MSLSNIYSNFCPQCELEIFDFEKSQSLITVSESTDKGMLDYKKVSVYEKVQVDGLDRLIFKKISTDPNLISKVLGAEIISVKNPNEFRLAIPGILGFDLKFDVTLTRIGDDQINVNLTNFNTFFHSGDAKIKLLQNENNEMSLKVSGNAFIPKSPAKIFIFGIGGEDNFIELLQNEVNNQVKLALARFGKMVEEGI